MKKHKTRPALRAIDVLRWIDKKILPVKRVKGTQILYLLSWKVVLQSWVRRNQKRQIKKETARTYLRVGIFLVPIWQKVPLWEIKYLQSQGQNPLIRGIILFKGVYLRLAYMQVEDLDHAIRQQDHVIDNYLNVYIKKDFPQLVNELQRQDEILQKVGERKMGAESLLTHIKLCLRSYNRSLGSILANAPIFKHGNFQEKDRQTIISALQNIIKECRSFSFRPICHRLRFARRSLTLAIEHIKNDNFRLAKARLKAALKNLEYPEPT